MATIAGCVVVGGKINFIRPQMHNNFKLQLSDKKEYMLGIDQSSSCTGLAIVSTDYSVVILLDVRRDAHNKEAFYGILLQVLSDIVRNQKICIIVRERPVPSHQYANRVLEELAGRVDAWVQILPELKGALYEKMFPQTWKKYVVNRELAEDNDQQFRKRCNSKSCVSYDVAQLFPGTSKYRDTHFSKDYDSFDALGILCGYLLYSCTPEGFIKIHGIKESRHVSLVFYAYVEKSTLDGTIEAMYRHLGRNYGIFDQVYLVFNDEYNKYDNIRMATSNWSSSVTVLPEKYLVELQWQFGFDLDPNKVMLMFMVHKKHYPKTFLNVVLEDVPWHEELK